MQLPKAPVNCARNADVRIVNEMAAAAREPVIYVGAMSISFTENITKACANRCLISR